MNEESQLNEQPELIDIGDQKVQLAIYNPRSISAQRFAALKESLKRFGDLSGVVKNVYTGNLVGGHQRIRAFSQMPNPKIVIEERLEQNSVGTVARGYVLIGDERYGYREVNWELPFEQAANVAANNIGGDFVDGQLAELIYGLNEDLRALTGFDEKELNHLLDISGANGETEEDEPPEVDDVNPPISQPGEIYQLGKHRLMCGDSTDFGTVSELMDGKQADMVFTDPPYGVSYQSNMRVQSEKFDVIKNDDVLITEWIEPMLEISKGFVFIWTSWKVLAEWLEITKRIGEISNMIIWDKGGGGIGDLTGTYATDYEVALVFNRGAKLTGDRLGSVWDVGKDSPSLYEHPTQKPTGLAEKAMLTTTFRDQIVLDLFGGSGSTMVAAEKLGRVCYMMELDPKYCDVIRKRYAKLVGQDVDWEAATPVINAESLGA